MKAKNKTILILTLVFTGILFCYSQVLADREWLERGDPFYGDVCWTTSQTTDPTEGWIICRYKDESASPPIDFPNIVGDLATFNYAVVPGLGCDEDATLCPTWSFFEMYIQDQVAQDYFVTTDPKGATLTKDPITQCGVYGAPSPLFTGVKWNPKVNYQNFKKDKSAPYIFSMTTKTGIQPGSCALPFVVASSLCYSDSFLGPTLISPFLENPRVFNCARQGDGSDEIISLTVWYDECSFSPDRFEAQNLSNPSQLLIVEEMDTPYVYYVEKYPPPGSDPRKHAAPVSRVGGISGGILCSEKTINTPSGNNLPGFLYDDKGLLIKVAP